MDYFNEKMQLQFTNGIMADPFSNMNPFSFMQLEQFPDILQNYSSEQSKALFDYLIQSNNISIINKPGQLGEYTALHWMTIKNEYELIEYLIDKFKVDVNSKASMGETPLLIAIKNCNYLTVELLIKHGADTHVRDAYNRSILHWIAYTGRVVILHYFQKYHSINNLNDIDQFLQNPLHIACASGFGDMINYLIDSGQIDMHAQDSNGNTCLHMAVKCGLPRICWKIVQQNGGECASLICVQNKQNQRPIDLIKNEKAPHFRKIKDWIRLELKTNKWLVNNVNNKKNDELFKENHIKSFDWSNLFKINSQQKMKLELQARFFSFPITLAFPILLQYYLFDTEELTLWRGLINYFGLILIGYLISKQPHRINHISGPENPFHLGFFAALALHNYATFYFNLLNSFNLFRFYDMVSVIFMISHIYFYLKVITSDPGISRESVKKADGLPYTIYDLMRTNAKESVNSGKDSFTWLISPGNIGAYIAKPLPHPQLYFCESCQIVQAIPSKHCKLCEGCCCKFDHHCVFIRKCVGLKNHRLFVSFLIMTLLCEFALFQAMFSYLIQENEKIKLINIGKETNEQISLLYLLFASRFHVRLIVVGIINLLATLSVLGLFCYQMKYVMLGFTSQFGPPTFIYQTITQLKNFNSSILFRINNIYIFFFKSYEENEKLYFKTQVQCWANRPPELTSYDSYLYPRDPHYQKDTGFGDSTTKSIKHKNNHVEIDLT